jgi:aminoglycoside phosphotransferase (APT) family kinase protein
MPARHLPLEELSDRLAPIVASWRPGARVDAIEEMPSGASSLTYLARLGSEAGPARVVVKVAPPGVPPVRNRDVLRQARLLVALESQTEIRVPRVEFEDPGDPPETPPLFAMDFVAGDSIEPNVDDVDDLPPPHAIRGRALDASTMLGHLHALDPGALGLQSDDAALSLTDEVDRWLDLFRSLDDPLTNGFERCATLLHEQVPAERPGVVLHGDYRLGNMLTHEDRVEAIIDWEIWSIGDPRLDVAWFLMNCDDVDQPTAIRRTPGMPASAELLAAYERASGAAVQEIEWFGALVRFKAASTMALIVKHNRRRPDPLPQLEEFAPHIDRYVTYALARLDR